ncbi:MAG: cytochrome c biogenesis protein CcsA [Gammaproteobacteria bacterium]|nr:cytochrome c biogenesis protein CcsA [Gammaproteobacteria bacterium]
MTTESVIAILLYLGITAWWGATAFRSGPPGPRSKYLLAAASSVPLLLQAMVLYPTIVTDAGLNMGFYNALSLVSWTVALIVIGVALFRPVENLAIVFLPFAALCLLLEQLLPSVRMVPASAPTGLRVHVVLSIGAYGLLAIAAVQALVVAVQERQLRLRHPVGVMRMLPPLKTMEDLLAQMLAIGFFLLSLSLATGLMFLEDLLGQHLAHKTALSMLAWFLFGFVLYGRWARGWRGMRLAGWTLGGFLALMLAYFGSKLVLELILHRV